MCHAPAERYTANGTDNRKNSRRYGESKRLYGQLANKPTRRQTNSPTDKLADKPTRRQTNSPTIKLAKKNQLAEIEIVTKIDVRFFGHMDVSFW